MLSMSHCTMEALGTQCRSPEVVWGPRHHPQSGGVGWRGSSQTTATARSCSRASVWQDLPAHGEKEHSRALQGLCSDTGRWARAHRPVPDNGKQLTFHWDFAAEGRAAFPLPGRSAAHKDRSMGLGLLPPGEAPFSQLAGCSGDCHYGKVRADGGHLLWPLRPPLPAHRSLWGLPSLGALQLPKTPRASCSSPGLRKQP